jgi:hypothetical protein
VNKAIFAEEIALSNSNDSTQRNTQRSEYFCVSEILTGAQYRTLKEEYAGGGT